MKTTTIHAAFAALLALIISTAVMATDRYGQDPSLQEEFLEDIVDICEVMKPYIDNDDNFLSLQLLVVKDKTLRGYYAPVEIKGYELSWNISEQEFADYDGKAHLMPDGKILFSISSFWEGRQFKCPEAENWGVKY